MRVVASITAEGFGSYGPAQTLRLGGQGPVAVVGDNGSGKSTIASKALVWCLYGKAAPERMGSGTRALKGKSVVGDGRKAATVTVVITDTATDETWTIERTRSRSKADRVTVRSSASGEMEEAAIEAVVGASYEVFTKTVVRGQGDIWNFAEATDTAKKVILDEVSGALALDPLYKAARAARSTAAAERDLASDRLRNLKHTEAEARAAGLRLEELRASWEKGREHRVAELRREVAALETAEAQAAAADARIDEVTKARAVVELARPGLDFSSYRTAVAAASGAVATAQAAAAVADRAWRDIENLRTGDTCPTCRQTIAADSDVAKSRQPAQAAVARTSADLQAAQRASAEAAQAEAAARAWLANEEQAWRSRLAAIPTVHTRRLPLAQQATQAARDRAEAARVGDNPYSVAVHKAIEDMDRLRRDVAIATALHRACESDVRLSDVWLAALSPKGARAHLSESALVAIEVEANRWLEALTEGTVSIEFPLDEKGAIDTRIAVQSQGEWVERDFLSFSGGERSRINMACDLGVAAAFGANRANPLALLVLDEAVFSGLDHRGQQALVRSVHTFGVADVVVIDHDPALSATIPRSVRVVKGADGFSALTEETHG